MTTMFGLRIEAVGGVGQPAASVGIAGLLTTLNTLFGVLPLGVFNTFPPARPPNATQYVSPPLIVKTIPPSVPGAGGTTVMWGCGPGPGAPFRTTSIMNCRPARAIRAAFTGPFVPRESW